MSTTLVPKVNVDVYTDVYAKNLRDHWYPNKNIVRLTRKFFGFGSGLALDYGCGSSENMQHLMRLGYDVYGTEITKEAIEECEFRIKNHSIYNKPFSNNWKLFLLDSDSLTLPFEDNTFDHILCNQVIYFLGTLESIEFLLKEFQRVLKPNGKLIITTMSLHNLQPIREGVRVEKNIWNWRKMNLYIFDDEQHVRKTFAKYFNISEIGYFDNNYLKSTGHHWIILADNSLDDKLKEN